MANYIKGDSVTNATSYTLHKRLSAATTPEDTATATQTTGGNISFNLDELIEAGKITPGTYIFSVKAHATGYISSEYSNDSAAFVVEDNHLEFTISPTPADATVVLLASGYAQSGNSIRVPAGTVVTWTVSKTGYITQSGNSTIVADATKSVVLVDENAAAGTPIHMNFTTTELISTNVPARLAKDAYIANCRQGFRAGSTISAIELPLTNNRTFITDTTSSTVNDVSIWAIDITTLTPIEKIIDNQTFSSQYSEVCGGQSIIVPINRTFDYPVCFGFANTPVGNTAITYKSESGNYLAGESFEIGVPIDNKGTYVVCAAVYGEGGLYITEDAVLNLTEIAKYNEAASSIMASNCWTANKSQIIPADTTIRVLDIKAGGDKVTGLNVYVVNAETNIIESMLADELEVVTEVSSAKDWTVARLYPNVSYSYPVYLLFNAERTNSSKNGICMVSNCAGSVLLVDDDKKPAIGDDLTDGPWTSKYHIGYAVYE